MDKLSREILQKTMRFLSLKGYKVLSEFALPNKKRVDIIAINLKKELYIKTKLNNLSIKKINDKKYRLYAGPFNNFNSLKLTYISLNKIGFDDLDIIKE